MELKRYLRPFQSSDIEVIKDVYRDGVQSISLDMYSQQQINIWSSLPYLPGLLDKPLEEGKGWVSCIEDEIEAFGLRYPFNRLALIYCRGRSFGQGHATSLLQRIQFEAANEGETSLITEASSCSYPLLIRLGWQLIRSQTILIGGVSFHRYIMRKKLIY